MICTNKHCWRCQRVHKKDKEMKKQGYNPVNFGDLGRVYIRVLGNLDKLQVSGTDGGANLKGEA